MTPNWPKLTEIHTIIFDFDGVFTDNNVLVNHQGMEFVRCNRGDGLGLGMLKRAATRSNPDLRIFVLSTEKDGVVSARAKKLNLECHQGVSDKNTFVTEHLKSRFQDWKSAWKGIVYLGNDLNDLEVIHKVGFSFAPADSHPRVKAAASAVGEKMGGNGFIREFAERLLVLDSMDLGEIYELVSNR